MSYSPADRGQTGKTLWILLLLIALIGLAAGYYYYDYSNSGGYNYRAGQPTELHGVVHWEHSNIPASGMTAVLYQSVEQADRELARQPVRQGYYRFQALPAEAILFIRVYPAQSTVPVFESEPVRLREGRARYLPLYLPSQRERRAGGFVDRLQGRIVVNAGRVYLSPTQETRIRLHGERLDELAGLNDYLVIVKGRARDRDSFEVGEYFVLEGDTGDRPMLGRLQQQKVDGQTRFVLAGEEDIQLLRVPANYRLRPRLEQNLGALVLLTGPVEEGAIKPLTLTVVKAR